MDTRGRTRILLFWIPGGGFGGRDLQLGCLPWIPGMDTQEEFARFEFPFWAPETREQFQHERVEGEDRDASGGKDLIRVTTTSFRQTSLDTHATVPWPVNRKT